MTYEYKAVIDRWVDGDTCDVTIDLGFNISLKERVRLARINAFETKGEYRDLGMLAKEKAESLAPPGSVVLLKTEKAKSYDKYN